MATTNISVEDALSEFYKLKSKFEMETKAMRTKIAHSDLSSREKYAEFLQLKPKCINCKRPSQRGTIFRISYNPDTAKGDSYRVFKAQCGDLANPCNLNIEIEVGKTDTLDSLMTGINSEIRATKNEIIDGKNKVLFGLTSEKDALENFDINRKFISDLMSLYEDYLQQWTHIVENPAKLQELQESITQSFDFIQQIRQCMSEYKTTGNEQLATDAARIYATLLQPLLTKIRNLKYRESGVLFEPAKDIHELVQLPYTVKDILVATFPSSVVAFDVGLKVMATKAAAANKTAAKPKKTAAKKGGGGGGVTEDNNDDFQEIPLSYSHSQQSSAATESNTATETPEEEPLFGYGKDGVLWTTPQYKAIWESLPELARIQFKMHPEWMKLYVTTCAANRRAGGELCKLIPAPGLIIPPKKTVSGTYNLGVSTYTDVFNGLPPNLQITYLAMYSEDPQTGAKNYKLMTDAITDVVAESMGMTSVAQ